MKLLVIGDVHGCYHTLKTMVEDHWNPEDTFLIQVGDLINKGPHSGKCVRYWRGLEDRFPYLVYMLRGNHEQMYINGYNNVSTLQVYDELAENFRRENLDPAKVYQWLSKLPLKWENPDLMITHGGINNRSKKPLSLNNRLGVLYNKSPLKDIGKTQIIGHDIMESNKPVFSPKENAWRIDTGAWGGDYLSGLLLNYNGQKVKVCSVATDHRDLN